MHAQKTDILIFGKNGQVASSLSKIFAEDKNIKYSNISSSEVDFSNPANLDIFFEKLSNNKNLPNIIINATAYTAVDNAENDFENCNNINHISVNKLAQFCASNKILLIHYSTDYVFDGSGEAPFSEDNTNNLNPLNIYGRTKLDAEHAIIASGCKYLIFRTSWVYNSVGKNFVNTMLKLFTEKQTLNIIDDQIGSPTYAYDIADITAKIINKLDLHNITSGIYNLTSEGFISWYHFTKLIAEMAKGKINIVTESINPIPTSQYPTPAKRPLNSRLSKEKLKADFSITPPTVEDALKRRLEQIFN